MRGICWIVIAEDNNGDIIGCSWPCVLWSGACYGRVCGIRDRAFIVSNQYDITVATSAALFREYIGIVQCQGNVA